MSIEELEADLPNGLHDALLRTLSVDYQSQRVEFILDIWIGALDADSELERERRRPARLVLEGLWYLVVDPPDTRSRFWDAGPVMIDLCGADESISQGRLAPGAGLAGRFFIYEWNAFIHFAAKEAHLSWVNPG